MWQKKFACLMATRKQRRIMERRQSQDIFFKDMSPVTFFFQLGPTFHSSTTSQ
jgi:hypothetical protein